jgi:Cd2+/Zn2+-exporting ATPase/Cu+-exporting ATPase
MQRLRLVGKRKELLRLALMAASAAASWLGLWRHLLPFDLIAILATLIGGYPIYKETFHSLRHKRISMEVSMALAIIVSFAVGQFTAAVVIAFFVILAEFLETYAVETGRETIAKLELAAPKKALVIRGGREIEIDSQHLCVGDRVVVRAGDRAPADGIVVEGSALVNQASITGETIPGEKNVGSYVYAGSINESGTLEVQVEKIGNETVYGKIIKLIEEAEGRRAPVQKIADRLSAWLVEFAIVFSVITYVVTRNVISAISVIVVAGACGVAAGTPLAIVATIGSAAKKGVIVKGGRYIEQMNQIDTVVIDKTGTLTFGEPIVTDLEPLGECTERELLEHAAQAEKHSNHPIAVAIVRRAATVGISPGQYSAFRYMPGKGVSVKSEGREIIVGNKILMEEKSVELTDGAKAEVSRRVSEGKTTVLVAHDQKLCGLITISDRIRAESQHAIEALRRTGIRTIMLTGDNKPAAEAVAKQIGTDEVYAELLPEDKVAFIKKLMATGHRVAMVGDGVNDTPALAYADVGIGMGAGTDVAAEEADIVLMTNDLRKISETVRMSKRTHRTIMENFYGTIIVDGLGIALAFLGFLNPLLAAGIHVASELAFISNSARLISSS